jgi:uncharacterized membrane protein (UPF0182 family)
MPQLKKVALAMGDHLVYEDTYKQALAQLIAENAPATAQKLVTPTAVPEPVSTQPSAAQKQEQQTLQQVRDHFNRYRELNSQGKYSEAGKELETIQNLLKNQ